MKIIEASLLAFSKMPLKFFFQLMELKKNNIFNVHYDVMDNEFVKNTAFFGEKLNFIIMNKFIVSVHLMVFDLEYYIDFFLKYKIEYLTFHCEATNLKNSIEFIKKIKEKNIKAGIAIKPETNIEEYKELFRYCDIVTIMGVEPGFGGQKFIESTINKLKAIKEMIPKKCLIQLDGGVNLEVIKKTKKFVDLFVSGSFLMNSKEKKEIQKSIEF